ncbi:hypothetical protein evm_001056 [Chilo suppressalis]|nr:hypothetical protein evm_001056 [Chilo suppressalis]
MEKLHLLRFDKNNLKEKENNFPRFLQKCLKMPSCAFRKCHNNTKNTDKANGVTFHSFPQDPRFKEKWTKVIQQDQRDEEWLPTKSTRICSAHFKESDLYLTPTGRRKVKLSAIPADRPTLELSNDFTEDLGEETVPSSPLENVYVSDTDSIFDSPIQIHLKKKLDVEKNFLSSPSQESKIGIVILEALGLPYSEAMSTLLMCGRLSNLRI